MLLAEAADPEWYAEWLDSYYARDIQELFGIRERTGFLNLLRLMLRQSGGLADYSALSRECDLSRPTVKAHLEAMTVACALTPVPPFHGGGRREIVRRPKVYGFDTGFVSFVRGWTSVRDDDRGPLWEHLVLDVLRTVTGGSGLAYWRDKSDREIDFVVVRGHEVDAIECKVQPDRFNPAALSIFRQSYPRGRNIIVSPGVAEPYDRRMGSLVVRIMDCRHLLAAAGQRADFEQKARRRDGAGQRRRRGGVVAESAAPMRRERGRCCHLDLSRNPETEARMYAIILHMKRTTIFVDEALEHDLKTIAGERRQSVASVVREALSEYVVAVKRASRPSLSFVAAGASGHADTADRHEEILWRESAARVEETLARGASRTAPRSRLARADRHGRRSG